MRFIDWFQPRIDGSLHWQQSLAITIAIGLIIGPGYMWWRYDYAPKTVARDTVERMIGLDSDFRVTRVYNQLNGHTGLFPRRTGGDTLVCGTMLVDGARVPVAMLAQSRRRGRMTDIALFWPGRTESVRYPTTGQMVLDVCTSEVARRTA